MLALAMHVMTHFVKTDQNVTTFFPMEFGPRCTVTFISPKCNNYEDLPKRLQLSFQNVITRNITSDGNEKSKVATIFLSVTS